MQWIASGFLFVRGRTIIHKLDPRTRLLLSGSLFVISLVSRIYELLVIISIAVVITLVARNLKRFGRAMVFAAILSLITFVLDFYLTPIWGKPIGFVPSVTFALRLFAVIASSSLFFLTTTPDELEQVMKWFRLPADFVMVFVIAVRFVPVLLLDALQIMDAQRSRGVEFEKGSILKRLRNTIPLLVPLIAIAVNRSLDLAEAMDSRAYGASKRPTNLYVLKLKLADYVTSIAVIAFSAIGVYIAIFTNLF